MFFGHWIGTVPWLWVGAGIAALAVGLAGRWFDAVAPWLAWTSLALGALTTVMGVSPRQYMAGMTGPLWLLSPRQRVVRSPPHTFDRTTVGRSLPTATGRASPGQPVVRRPDR